MVNESQLQQIRWNDVLATNNIATDHLAQYDVFWNWFKVAAPLALASCVSLAIALVAYSAVNWILFGSFAFAFVAGIALFIVSISSFDAAKGTLSKRKELYAEIVEAVREFEERRIEITREQVQTVKVGSGGTAIIGGQTTQNQLIVDDKDKVLTFLRHRREFIERVRRLREQDKSGQVTGTERNTWVKATVDGKPYVFNDGQPIGWVEYEQLLDSLAGTPYEPIGRQKGTRGKRVDLQPTDDTHLLDANYEVK